MAAYDVDNIKKIIYEKEPENFYNFAEENSINFQVRITASTHCFRCLL